MASNTMLKIIERQGRKKLLFSIKLNKTQKGPTHYFTLNLQKVFMCKVRKICVFKENTFKYHTHQLKISFVNRFNLCQRTLLILQMKDLFKEPLPLAVWLYKQPYSLMLHRVITSQTDKSQTSYNHWWYPKYWMVKPLNLIYIETTWPSCTTCQGKGNMYTPWCSALAN